MNQFIKWTLVCFIVTACSILHANTPLKIEIDGKIVDSSSDISLFSGYHVVVFHFPRNLKSQTKYTFRLGELESSWQKTEFPMARYTNLNGGNYTFEMEYLSSANKKVLLTKAFQIKENFWEKWWFYLLIGISAMAGVSIMIYFWFLYDWRQKMRTQAIRQKIAADLHDEVGANLSSIGFLVESLKKSLNGQKEKFDPILDRISGNSLETAGLINDTIWALNPDYDNFEKLLERIKSFGSSILSAKDIAFSIENHLETSEIELNIEERRNLFFAIKEAINNAAKHSEASKVILKIWRADNFIHLSIIDNGLGFNTEILNEGNGLKNFKMRDNLDISLDSKIGKGTKVEIVLKSQNH